MHRDRVGSGLSFEPIWNKSVESAQILISNPAVFILISTLCYDEASIHCHSDRFSLTRMSHQFITMVAFFGRILLLTTRCVSGVATLLNVNGSLVDETA